MTAQELLRELINCEGPCHRMCSYCPEQGNLSEIKEVVENLIKDNYKLKEALDMVLSRTSELQEKVKAYLDETGDPIYTQDERKPYGYTQPDNELN